MRPATLALGLALCLVLPGTSPAAAPDRDAPFMSIDGGTLSLADWRGQPVLVVNTASQCAYTGQYEGLQDLQDRYVDAGLVVLAVPSDAFDQELDSGAEVREFCEMSFDLTLPMTDITPVRGPGVHPFYAWVAERSGFTPRWNFNKVLIGRDGAVIDTFGANVRPGSARMTRAIEAALE